VPGGKTVVQSDGGERASRDGGKARRAGRGGRDVRAQEDRASSARGGRAPPARAGAAEPIGGRVGPRGGPGSRGKRTESPADREHGARVPSGREVSPAARPLPRFRGGRVAARRRRRDGTAADAAATADRHPTTFLRGRRRVGRGTPARVPSHVAVVTGADGRIPAGDRAEEPRPVAGTPAVPGHAGRRGTGTGVGRTARRAGTVRTDRGTGAQADRNRGRPRASMSRATGRRRRRTFAAGQGAVRGARPAGRGTGVRGPRAPADGSRRLGR